MATTLDFEVDFEVVGDDERAHIERVRRHRGNDEIVGVGHHDWSANTERIGSGTGWRRDE